MYVTINSNGNDENKLSCIDDSYSVRTCRARLGDVKQRIGI
jgi:hypothetical protein